MERKTENILTVLAIIIVLWFIFSLVDVNLHNMSDQAYSKVNLIVIVFNLLGGN